MTQDWKPVVKQVEQAARMLIRAAEDLPEAGLDERERKALSRAIGQASQSLGVFKRRTAGQTKSGPGS